MIELLWPSKCVGCDARGAGALCEACRPTGLIAVPTPPEGCRHAWAAGAYAGPLGRALRRAKFEPDRRTGALLARELARLAHGIPMPDVVVPAPSSLSSRVRRGFGTGDLLAAHVGPRLGVQVVRALTVRRGPRQSTLSRRRRSGNLAGRVRARRSVSGRVLIIDDVVTTGATAAACARELLCVGAREVWLLTLCAALPDPASESHDTTGSPFRF